MSAPSITFSTFSLLPGLEEQQAEGSAHQDLRLTEALMISGRRLVACKLLEEPEADKRFVCLNAVCLILTPY